MRLFNAIAVLLAALLFPIQVQLAQSGTSYIAHPAQRAGTMHTYTPYWTCGTGPFYDTNGNRLAYDVDGTEPGPLRNFIYDNEYGSLSVNAGGVVTTMALKPMAE